jgi:hypothetical protein
MKTKVSIVIEVSIVLPVDDIYRLLLQRRVCR